MSSKKDQFLAYCITVVFLLIGVVGYAAFPEKVPDSPYRILFQSLGGKVQFSHAKHVSDYGVGCIDCHHTNAEGDKMENCGSCHTPTSEDPIKRSDAFHKQCIKCHENAGPTQCQGCHML